MSSIVRSSKFRHVFGKASQRQDCYDGLRITRNAWDRDFCAVNPKFVAVVLEAGGGGAFIVLPLSQVGRVPLAAPKVTGHTSAVMDIAWDPFNDNIIASCSEDCTIKVWEIPEGGIEEDLREPIADMQGHERKVGEIQWHPVAKDIIISSAFDWTVRLWCVATAEELQCIECHTDTIYTMAWNPDGSLFATTSKDKIIRVIDPRSGEVVSEGSGHQGSKASRCVFVGKNLLLTTGFSRMSERQYALWNPKDIGRGALTMEQVDTAAGVLFPYYDPDVRMVYLAGKGDGNLRYYEITDEAPYCFFLSEYKSKFPQRGLGFMPKRGLNVNDCEVARFYKLQSTGLVEPIAMTVPRKSDNFQHDIYPPTASGESGLTAEEWIDGKNAMPKKIDMSTFFAGTVRTRSNKGTLRMGRTDSSSDAAASESKPAPTKTHTPSAASQQTSVSKITSTQSSKSAASKTSSTSSASFEKQRDVSDVKKIFSSSTTSSSAASESAAPAAAKASSSDSAGVSRAQITALNGKIATMERALQDITAALSGLKSEVAKLK